MAAFALGGVSLSTWGPRLPTLRADLGVTDAVIGAVLAGVTVGSITGLLLASPLLTRFGARRAMLGVLLLVAAGIALVGFAAGTLHAVAPTVLGFVAVGLGIGALDVMINVEGAAVEAAAERTLMPLMHAAWSAGAILGAALGAACAALEVPPATQFAGEAVAIAVLAVVTVRFVPASEHGPAQEDRPSAAERIRGWARGWTDWRLLLIGAVMLGVELGEGSANNWLTLAVRDGHRQPDATAALFFVAFAAGETTARVLGGPLVDRLGRVRTIRITTALGAVGLVLFILGGAPWIVLVGVLLWAVGVSMGFPLGMSAAAESGYGAAAESGADAAARVSVVASIGYLANLAGPPVVGLLSQGFGLLNALWLVVLLLALGFAAAGALRPRSA
ncbi:MFS transporter [Amnibacterium sp. CER49]|uniref:MFS transporter n=1 Tax=Amnibacterium sp. CER49 TaxID=3039161 RepID=UPI00244A373E|nr:MFS transporter [Amnibacterium sp. CER49]MDH2443412.1 MFS transporter [Amnibacterium sp. CER49]